MQKIKIKGTCEMKRKTNMRNKFIYKDFNRNIFAIKGIVSHSMNISLPLSLNPLILKPFILEPLILLPLLLLLLLL